VILNAVCLDGKDLFQFGKILIAHFREELLKAVTTVSEGKHASADWFSYDDLIRIIETLATAANEVKKSLQSSLPLELAFIKLTTTRPVISDLESRVAKLESILKDHPDSSASAVAKMKAAPLSEIMPPSGSGNFPGKETQPPPSFTPPVNSEPFIQWLDFLEAVKKKKRTLAALIQEGKPLNYNGRELVVGLAPNLKFHLENLMQSQNKELLESIIKEVCGQTISLSCVPLPEEAPARDKTKTATAGPDLVNEAVKLFGGEVKPLPKEE